MDQNGELRVASQRVADVLAKRILAGELEPGARIKQDELATELGVSRIPVRDALQMLETRGLVTLKANASARVIRHSVADIKTSYEIRLHLEPMLLARSIPNLTDGDVSEMRAIFDQMELAGTVEELNSLHRDFFWKSFSRHDVPLLANIVERLWDAPTSYKKAFSQQALANGPAKDLAQAENRLYMLAIERREADVASAILETKTRRIGHILERFNEDLVRAE